ncbi:MAG: LLM class flavin-dependent oxidoreductase [Actinomycetota bacterium]
MAADVGLCFHREAPASGVVDMARVAERVGYDEFWVIEDCFYTAGVSLAAAALTGTTSIDVGIGIMPAVARNPAITAMEIATLANLAPGRFHAGIGHGVQEWMAQMGVRPSSPLTALDETLDVVRRLLRGKTVTVDGATVSMDRVALDAPPDPVPLVSAGVRGPKSLALSGRAADGTILADFCSPDYVRWAREQITAGGGGADHRLTVFASALISPNGTSSRRAMAPFLANLCEDPPPSLRMAPFFDELAETAAKTSWLDVVRSMPVEWWQQIAPVGSPDDAAIHLQALFDAGADAVAIFPDETNSAIAARLFAEQVLPQLR